ncbi:MAG TPA: hypothetical protein VF221_18795, partial [Chloroflexota bacterium]
MNGILPQRFRVRALGLVLVAVFVAGLAALPSVGSAAPGTPSFAASSVSTSLAGGEPFVIYSHGTGNLVYSSHEGTT